MLSLSDFKQKKILIAALSRGDKVSFKNSNIIIKDSAGIKHQSSCYRLFALFIIGHTSITSGLLQRAKRYKFSIVMLTHGMRPYGTWFAQGEGNVLLRRKQYQYNGNEIAQHLIANKIDQQIITLKKRRARTESLNAAIISLQQYRDRLPDQELDFQQILGIEGIAARVYFKQMFDQPSMNWQGRKPRAKRDCPNLLLDIGYTQLFNLIDALLQLYGFDTYQGVYHQLFYQRKSLTCDLVEPFRPLIDQNVRKMFTLNQVKQDDFQIIHGQYRVFGKQAQHYSGILLKSLLDYKEPIFVYIQQYYRAFMQQKTTQDYPIFTGEKHANSDL